MTVIFVLTPVINGRYELAISLPKENKKAYLLFLLTIIINITVTILFSCIIYLLDDHLFNIFNLKYTMWIYFLPLGLFLVGLLNSLTYLNNRWQRFNYLARSKINQSVSMSISQVIFGLTKIGVIGLILGYCIGHLSSILHLQKDSKIRMKLKENKLNKMTNIKEVASEYNAFPKFAMVTHSTEAASSNLPNILLSKFFGTQYAGYYSLTTRTINLPLSLVGRAIGDVFLSTASKEYREKGECTTIFLKTFKILAFIPIVPLILLFLYSEEIFSFVFGSEWVIAGEYAKLLIPALYLQFISNPLSHMFIIAKKVRLEFFIQILILLLSIFAFYIGFFYFESYSISVMLFSMVLTIKYLIFIIFSYTFSKEKSILINR